MDNSAKTKGHDLGIPDARRSVLWLLIAMTTLSIVALFLLSLSYFKSLDQETAQTRLSLYQRSLNDTLKRFQHLPFVLARDEQVIATLEGQSTQLLNHRLASFSDEAELEAIYLMDKTGLVLSSSNFKDQISFVGQNYGFRPYFTKALAGERGNYFGVGATTGRPGFFVSEPVYNKSGEPFGVIAIKLDASELQETWERGGEDVLATDPNGIVVLASNRNWLYGTTKPLTEEQLQHIKNTKQFGGVQFTDIGWTQVAPNNVELGESDFITASAAADHLDWRVQYLLSDGRAYERAFLTTIVFGSAISILVGIAAYTRSKRIEAALLTSQKDRDRLRTANKELETAQQELARKSKLAALGQLSASVVHELGQPISALKNYLAAEEISGESKSKSALPKLAGVVDRMDNITKELRFFTKPGDTALEAVVLVDVINSALELMKHDFKAASIEIQVEQLSPDVAVMANRLRLEQVLVNLLRNSLSSLQEAGQTELKIAVFAQGGNAYIKVADSGIGFGERTLSDLQEPFHTTKASGDGMGLGLSIATAIVKEHGGQMSARNLVSGGSEFAISLPLITLKAEK